MSSAIMTPNAGCRLKPPRSNTAMLRWVRPRTRRPANKSFSILDESMFIYVLTSLKGANSTNSYIQFNVGIV